MADTVTPPLGRLAAQVRDELARRIARADLGPGAQLPTERELGVEFGVSRVTVRRALSDLVDQGLVFAIQGRGTFVAGDQLGEPPNLLLSFHDMAATGSVAVGARLLRADVRGATLHEAEQFGVAPGAELVELERLRTLDGLPVAVDRNLLPLAIDPELPGLDWSRESLYSRLDTAGHAPVEAEYVVEARAADERLAGLLGTEPGFPLLVAESEASDPTGRLVVTGVIAYRGDRYRFRSRQSARGGRHAKA